MSGRDKSNINSAMGRLKDRIMRTVSDVDDTPQHHGYQRVQGGEGTLSTSTTGTSLDTILIDDGNLLSLSGGQQTRQRSPIRSGTEEKPFTPIIEGDDINEPPPLISERQLRTGGDQQKQQQQQQQHKSSKQSLKGSRVSFEPTQADSSDEDSFEEKRDQYQQRKTVSVDHKGILKDLKNILATDNRKSFQSKKHVSLDVKGTRFLDELLKGSSSEEEEFKNTRKEFQSRKHQSLDPRVSFKLDKEFTTSTSSDEDGDVEKKSLIHKRFKDITKPVIIDLKDFESEDEDFISTRKSFQQQRSISLESRKSHRIFEMDEMGSKKSENLRNAVPYVRQITEDGKPKLEVYRPTTNPIYIYTQLLAALSVSMGSLVVGFASSYTSPALVSMTDRNITSFPVTEQEASWVGGLMPLAGLAGGIAGGPLIEYLGRKNTILATAVPFIVSWLLIACAVNVGMILAGRSLAGFCVGIASLSLPVYLGETVQPEVRGTLGLLPTAFGNVGILICFFAGKYMDWSMLAYFGSALPVPFLILMFFIPETPRWYVSKNREESARKALVWLRGKEADVEPELKGLFRSAADAERKANANAFMELLKWNNLKPLSISLGLMFFQQASGINAVIFYTVSIFRDAGTSIDENWCTIIVGCVNFIAVFIATVLIDRLGRKILLYISATTMIFTLSALGAFFFIKETGGDAASIGWLPLASAVIYVVGFSLGFGPIPWLMMGEILPARIRGSAASVATGFNWACTFIVTKTFADLKALMGPHGVFWLFAVFCVIALFFVIFYVPETQGKTLEDIERKMMGRVRRMSSVANIKPLSFNM